MARSFGRNSRVGQLSMMAGRDGARLDVGERLRGEHDARVLLAQRLEPLAQLRPEGRIVEREPALIDDQQGRASVEPALDTMEQVGEHGRCRAGADQSFSFEGLDIRLAKPFGLGVQQPAPRASDAIRLQRLLQRGGLEQDREAREGTFAGPGRSRVMSMPTTGAPWIPG